VIGLLGFLLGTAAAMAVAGALVSAGTVAAWPLVARLSAARRADAALVMGVAPAASALTLGLAVAIPSVRDAIGFGVDHCAQHLHHGHLCWLHSDSLPPSLAALGACALALLALRIAAPVGRTWRAGRAATALGRVARSEGGVVWVRGTSLVCHVVGLISPQVYVSESLARDLEPTSLDVVLDHERAHVARRDPAIGFLVSVAAAFGLPGVSDRWKAAWRQAAEEAADAEAARVHGPLAVASALVAYERLRAEPGPALGVGFGETSLEARVLHLLDGHPVARRTLALPVLALVLTAVALLAFGRSDVLHHHVEEAVHALHGDRSG
jgi:hypothetical protein